MEPNLSLLFSHQSINVLQSFKPVPFILKNVEQRDELSALLRGHSGIEVVDTIASQVKELVKLRHPGRFNESLFVEEYNKYLNGREPELTGVWWYYPWSRKLVHILGEKEFIEVRTNRNKLKITEDEQNLLNQKTVGIIGLSVGQSVALTMCMERCCGKMKLADFDELELSNLNRLRTGLHNLGQKKVIIAAREIAEIDPYIEIEIFDRGITDENMDAFFSGLDLMVEVCDGLDVKLSSRLKARELRIPVVMDTNDRGMVDIERFDLEPDRELLHGLVSQKDLEEVALYSPQQKLEFIYRIISYEDTSEKLRHSMTQINKSITSWPQLASSVVLGGAVTTDVARRIFLNQLRVSGRFYIDFDELISN